MTTDDDVPDGPDSIGPAFDAIADVAAQLAAAWVRQGRYASIDDALDPAILAAATVLESRLPHVLRQALAEYDRAHPAQQDGRDD